MSPYWAEAWAYGGIPRVVGAQARGLAARGMAVTVATTDARDAESRLSPPEGVDGRRPWEQTTEDGVRVRVFPNRSNALAFRKQLFLPRGFAQFVDEAARSFQIAHLHGCHNVPGALAARALRRAGVPWVVQPNGTAGRIERRRAAKMAFDLSLGRSVVRDASRLIAVSEIERWQLSASGGGEQRISLVPNPVDSDEVTPAPDGAAFRTGLGLGEGPLIVYLGQLSPRKRVDLAVRALAALPGPARLIVAGPDMGVEGSLRRLVRRLGLGERVLFLGVLVGRERLDALAGADAVVYPSRDEIFGLVPLEALLSGTPVVVSGDSGCGEVIHATGGGVVVPYGDVEALAKGMARTALQPEAWRERVARAADRVRRWYGVPSVSERLERIYRQVIAERG